MNFYDDDRELRNLEPPVLMRTKKVQPYFQEVWDQRRNILYKSDVLRLFFEPYMDESIVQYLDEESRSEVIMMRKLMQKFFDKLEKTTDDREKQEIMDIIETNIYKDVLDVIIDDVKF